MLRSLDTMTLVENRLRLVTDSVEELNSVQEERQGDVITGDLLNIPDGLVEQYRLCQSFNRNGS